MSGVDDCCGVIQAGRAADFNVMGADLELETTYVGGVPVR